MIYDSCEIWSAPDRIVLRSKAIFCHFTPITAQKMKIKKKEKKPWDIIILNKCTKNHDDRLYCFWDMVHERCNCYFSFWAILFPFNPITAQNIKIPKKKKNNPGDIITLHRCNKNHDHVL